MNNKVFSYLRSDLSSGLVVFLVALPLCLGIAMASGAPLFSGVIAGIIGGIVVGVLSQSHVSVTGPAAGLTAIVLSAITVLGSFELFLLSVVIAGILQLILGYIKAGTISNYFPNNVIEGMLAGIGVIIFLKQLPHAFGYDRDTEGDMYFQEASGSNTLLSLFDAFQHIHLGATIITGISLILLLLWDKVSFLKKLKLVPGALVAVIISILFNEIFYHFIPDIYVSQSHLVNLPTGVEHFSALITFPDFGGLQNQQVWITALTLAVVASIETLLCIEAGDRMDKYKRYTPANTELKAQGVGNIISGLIGGLPMTSVVVRTTANVNAGAKTKLSAIFHGVLLLVCVIAIPNLLNKIPLATLAAILLLIGYKLASPSKLMHYWNQGKYQFLPFIATVLAVVFTDLLKGVAIGLVISVVFVLQGNLKKAYFFKKENYKEGDIIHIELAQEVSFLNKAAIKLTLAHLPENSKVVINAEQSLYIAHDVLELISEFQSVTGPERNIEVILIGFKEKYGIENSSLTLAEKVWLEKSNN